MDKSFLIYGAYGYTGELISREAVSRGLNPVLGGRNVQKLQDLAERLNCRFRVFSLENPEAIEHGIEEMDVVLNCAGPFSETARPMMEACIRRKTHYLDITGEIEVFELAHRMGEKAKAAGVLLLPGVGFDVVPSDCLAAAVAEKLPGADSLEISFMSGAGFSAGTALTMALNFHKGGAIRKAGKIVSVPHAFETKFVKFNHKELLTVTIPWGDVATAWYSTGIPNIKVFVAQPPRMVRLLQTVAGMQALLGLKPFQFLMKKYIKKKVQGPSEEERKRAGCFFHAIAGGADGSYREARLKTPEGYSLTATTAVLAVGKILNNFTEKTGFQTPSQAFGKGFIREVEGVELYE